MLTNLVQSVVAQTPPALAEAATTATNAATTSLGQVTATSIIFFVAFITLTLYITYWAAKKTKTAAEFYAAGRSITGFQNGIALSGDYMSAASFLGIAGMVSLKGYDGMIYATGWLVGWPALMYLLAEPLRNLGKYTFADVVAYPPEAGRSASPPRSAAFSSSSPTRSRRWSAPAT